MVLINQPYILDIIANLNNYVVKPSHLASSMFMYTIKNNKLQHLEQHNKNINKNGCCLIKKESF